MELSAERRVKAFEVIKGFVILARGILKVSKATALWDRLLKKNDVVSEKIITKSIKAFTRFCTQYGANIRSERLDFPKETKIRYSEIIFIDVNLLLKYSDEDDKVAVKEYFLTLSALLIKDEESLSLLNTINSLKAADEERESAGQSQVFQNFNSKSLGIDTTTPAGEFFGGILDKVGNVFKDGGDMSNPMTAITKLMSSGLMTDVTSGASSKINNGELSVGEIFGCLQQVVQKIAMTNPTTTTTTSSTADDAVVEEDEEQDEEEDGGDGDGGEDQGEQDEDEEENEDEEEENEDEEGEGDEGEGEESVD